MKKIFFILIFALHIAIELHASKIKGRVVDMNSGEPLTYAVIHIKNTTLGTSYAKLKFTQYREAVIDFEYEYTTDAEKDFKE